MPEPLTRAGVIAGVGVGVAAGLGLVEVMEVGVVVALAVRVALVWVGVGLELVDSVAPGVGVLLTGGGALATTGACSNGAMRMAAIAQTLRTRRMYRDARA